MQTINLFGLASLLVLRYKKRTGAREGTYVSLWLIHAAGWQKPTQGCKAIILQFKISLKKEQVQMCD